MVVVLRAVQPMLFNCLGYPAHLLHLCFRWLSRYPTHILSDYPALAVGSFQPMLQPAEAKFFLLTAGLTAVIIKAEMLC